MLTTKKLISWLTFIAIFTLSMQSCIHDDIYSSSDLTSEEYHSKSVFKEDEKYIKNVMDIYFENEETIKKNAGIPLWDYAMTMGTMDESFLIVPVADGKTVITCLQVPRNGNNVRFLYDYDRDHIRFFQNYILSEKREPVKQEPYSNPTGKGLAECKVTAVSMWYPADEYGSNAGYWETNYIITCPPEQTDGDGNEWGSGNNTYPYLGGGNNGTSNSNANQDIINNLQGYPCAQSLVQQLPTLSNDLAIAMRQIFQNNDNYNIIFRPKSNMGNVDGSTFSSHTNTGTFTAFIDINDQVLAHATKEYILVTMYHEVIHAFLDYEKFTLGDAAFQQKYPGVIVGYDYTADGIIVNRYIYIDGHQQLMPFLTTLQNILSQYNPNLPQNVIVAMARTGIATTTPEQKQLNSNEKNTTLGNHKGTACP